mmetsp:Transcript_7951/g.24554  ORF Transcript_7951/g.24554 Transcript_7951/m.24554 type:complete len:504 (-) Transcript_7951:174-1685(-)
MESWQCAGPRRRARSSSLDSAEGDEQKRCEESLSRSWSASPSTVASPPTSKVAQRNARRRERKKVAASRATSESSSSRRGQERGGETTQVGDFSTEKQLKRTRKSLRAIEELLRSETLSEEQRQKVSKRDGLTANAAALEAKLSSETESRRKHDAVVAALEAVAFDAAFECGVCFEVLETPTKITACGHEFCRFCVEEIVRRATRAADVACPLCRANFYDGTSKSAKLAVAAATRSRLKKATGRCHCGRFVPLSALRDHLRVCGDAARCYEPRAKFGHDFLKPDFLSALDLDSGRPSTGGSPLLHGRGAPLDGALAAAMVRRFEDNGGLAIQPPQQQQPSAAPPPQQQHDLRTTAPAAEEEQTRTEVRSTPAVRSQERTTTPTPPPSLREIMLQEEAHRRRPQRTAVPRQEEVPQAVPFTAFLSGADKQRLSAAGRAKAPWSEPPKAAPSVQQILAEEDRKRRDLAERTSSPWAGAVARQLRQATTPPRPPPSSSSRPSTKVH